MRLNLGLPPPFSSMMMHGKTMCALCWVACVLLIVGALNWGLVGLGWLFGGADWNVVHMIFGQWMKVEAVVYVLVGIAGIYKLFFYSMCCGKCDCKK